MKKIMAHIIMLIVLISLATEIIHHHNDFDTHDDCPICIAIQHQTASKPSQFIFVPVLRSAVDAIDRHTPENCVVTLNHYQPANNRAPPA